MYECDRFNKGGFDMKKNDNMEDIKKNVSELLSDENLSKLSGETLMEMKKMVDEYKGDIFDEEFENFKKDEE